MARSNENVILHQNNEKFCVDHLCPECYENLVVIPSRECSIEAEILFLRMVKEFGENLVFELATLDTYKALSPLSLKNDESQIKFLLDSCFKDNHTMFENVWFESYGCKYTAKPHVNQFNKNEHKISFVLKEQALSITQ